MEIIKNGKSNEARFKFDMFRWRMQQTELVGIVVSVEIVYYVILVYKIF